MFELIEQLGPGDHVALFYRSRAEQFAVTIPYLCEGLRRNEQCLYIAAENTIKSVRDALKSAGIDVDAAERRGALNVTTPNETYLRHGQFEPQKMIDDLVAAVAQSLSRGFAAFRATGELIWAASMPSALARVQDYEAELDRQFPGRFLGLCQYNENGFSPRALSHMLRVHPKVIARGQLFENPFYIPPGVSRDEHLPLVTIEDALSVASAAVGATPSMRI